MSSYDELVNELLETDPPPWIQSPARSQYGFRYRNADLAVVWTTSQPQTLEAALEYFHKVEGWGLHPQYLEMREAGQSDWVMVKKQFIKGEVVDV